MSNRAWRGPPAGKEGLQWRHPERADIGSATMHHVPEEALCGFNHIVIACPARA